MYFWLSLDGENIDFAGIEKELQIELNDNRIEAPEESADNGNCHVFYGQIEWLLDFAEKNKAVI